MDISACNFNSHSNLTLCEYIWTECDRNYFLIARMALCYQPTLILIFLAVSVCIMSCVAILVLMTGIILSNYLLHSVMSLSEKLNVNREMLSYVVVPFMNGAPDLVNSHLMMKSGSINLVIGQIIGANLVSFTVIVGSITILRPFTVTSKHGLVLGYSFACMMVLLLTYVLWDGRITILECLLLTSLYPMQVGMAHFDKSSEPILSDQESVLPKYPTDEHSHLLTRPHPLEEPTTLLADIPKFQMLHIVLGRTFYYLDYILFFVLPTSNATMSLSKVPASSYKHNLKSSSWFHFWLTFASAILVSTFTTSLSPSLFLAFILVTFGVSRLLNSYLLAGLSDSLIDVACFMSSMGLMTNITKMLILFLKNFEIMWQISEYVMGILVFSLVSSLNDILMNTLLALDTSLYLGIKACMSSCCLLVLMGIGFNGLWELIHVACRESRPALTVSLPVALTWELYSSLIALNITVILALSYMVLTKWKMDKYLGIGLVGVWLIAITACIVLELNETS